MIKLYLNTIRNEWYTQDGSLTGNGNPQVPYRNHETVGIQCVVDSPSAGTADIDPEADWTKDTQFAAYSGVTALLSTDDNYLRHLLGSLPQAVPSGSVASVTASIPSATLASVPDTGTIRLFDARGDYEELEYTARTIQGNAVEFTIASGASLEKAYPKDSVMDCGDGIYAQAALDAQHSDPATGYFQFNLFCYSKKLRLAVDYSDSPTVEDVRGLELLVFDIDSQTGISSVRGTYLCRDFSIPVPMALPPAEPEPSEETENRLAAVVNAMLAYGFSVQFSADGESWHSTQADGESYFRFRSTAGGGDWSVAILVPAGAMGISSYLYIAFASSAAGADFSLTPADGHKYVAFLVVQEPIANPAASDFAGKWVRFAGQDGNGIDSVTATTLSPGSSATANLVNRVLNLGIPQGIAGASAYLYIRYASDTSGTDFSTTPSNLRKYVAIRVTSSPIANPSASDFAGLWVKFIGDDGDNAFVIDDALSGTSENAVQNKVVKAALDVVSAAITQIQAALLTKQATLTFDSSPTQNSNNPVTSGGIYTAIQNAGGGGSYDSIADQNVVSPIDSLSTIENYYDNGLHGFGAGIEKTIVAVNGNSGEGDLKSGHLYALKTFDPPLDVTLEPVITWIWSWTWESVTYYVLDSETYGRFAGDYYADSVGGGWLRFGGGYRIISKPRIGSSTSYFIVPEGYDYASKNAGQITAEIQRTTDPLDGEVFPSMPGTLTQTSFPKLADRWVYRIYSPSSGIKCLAVDITPCVSGTCPLEARIAALESA